MDTELHINVPDIPLNQPGEPDMDLGLCGHKLQHVLLYNDDSGSHDYLHIAILPESDKLWVLCLYRSRLAVTR